MEGGPERGSNKGGDVRDEGGVLRPGQSTTVFHGIQSSKACTPPDLRDQGRRGSRGLTKPEVRPGDLKGREREGVVDAAGE